MSYLFYQKEDIENIKSLLKDNLGIQYALPDYNLSKGLQSPYYGIES